MKCSRALHCYGAASRPWRKATRHAIDAPLRQHHDGLTRRRGRAPLDATGAPAAWDSETGVWVGVAKKTKPDGVPKPRGRAPLGAEWNYETGEWEGGAKTSAKKKK